MELLKHRLEHLRDQLRARGQRPSLMIPAGAANAHEVAEAMEIVEEYGALCEAMYLMMAVDNKVVNAEREVLRGALDVLSEGRVRTRHMESMIDAAAKRVAAEGIPKRLAKVLDVLREDPARAETCVVLAAAIAAADNRIVPEEHALLAKMFEGLGLDATRANEVLKDIDQEVSAKKA